MLFRTKLSILQLVICLIPAVHVGAQQSFKIAQIEFEGLQRLSAEDLIATTQLKVGQQFELAALDAAAQRLIDSGDFKNVAYRTRPNRDEITITFIVEEAKVRTSKVIFDNFVWFSDTQLLAAIQRDVPSFDGTAPDNGNTVERITKSLQRFLHENQIEATVSYMASQDAPGSSSQEHVFSVTGIPLPICTLHFPGATNISEAKLVESSKSLIGSDYSNKYVSLFALSTLFPLYREVGQLKAEFSPPLAKPEESATCKSGVELTIPVAEGIAYKWDKAEWVGAKALSPHELGAMLDLQSGQAANGLKIDKGTSEIKKAYGRKGYLLVTVSSIPDFDDAAGTVSYRMEVHEGPQFKMGQFITKGFPESADQLLHQRWSLKTGEVYDQGYPSEFSQKQMNEILRSMFLERRAQGKPTPNLKWSESPNPTTLTVDVTLELTN